MIGGICTTGTSHTARSRNHQMLMSSSPSPTTVMPITVPDENATRRPALSDSLAPCAVRALARVAIDMPMNPASAEKKPPVMNANGTNGDSSFSPKEMIASTTNSRMKNRPTTLYCCFR